MDKNREAFENKFLPKDGSFFWNELARQYDGIGDYDFICQIQAQWEAWQAALSQEQEAERESDPFCWTWAGCLYTKDKVRAEKMCKRGFNVEPLYTRPQPATIPEVRAQPTQRDVDNALELVRLVESGDLKDCTDNDGVAYQSEWLDESVSRINRFIQEFALTAAERTEAEKVFQDAAQYGSGFIIVGKHVSRSEVIATHTEEESEDAPAWWVSANGDFTQDPVVVERAARYSHVWEPLYKRPKPATIPDWFAGEITVAEAQTKLRTPSVGHAKHYARGWNDRCTAMLSAAPSPAEEGWISCSEKFPQLGQRVILKIGEIVQWYMPALESDDDGHYWDFDDCNDAGALEVDLELHSWMPMPTGLHRPQPPKGEE